MSKILGFMVGAVVGAIGGGILAERVCPRFESEVIPPYVCPWSMYIFGGALVGVITSVFVENL